MFSHAGSHERVLLSTVFNHLVNSCIQNQLPADVCGFSVNHFHFSSLILPIASFLAVKIFNPLAVFHAEIMSDCCLDDNSPSFFNHHNSLTLSSWSALISRIDVFNLVQKALGIHFNASKLIVDSFATQFLSYHTNGITGIDDIILPNDSLIQLTCLDMKSSHFHIFIPIFTIRYTIITVIIANTNSSAVFQTLVTIK
jgi:hypothetical protein